jgi:class 3 adenylate cyclase
MRALCTTAILKTDLRGSTPTFRGLPEADLDAMLREHRAFVTRLTAAHDGRIVKPEGDGFWVVFPSVFARSSAALVRWPQTLFSVKLDCKSPEKRLSEPPSDVSGTV